MNTDSADTAKDLYQSSKILYPEEIKLESVNLGKILLLQNILSRFTPVSFAEASEAILHPNFTTSVEYIRQLGILVTKAAGTYKKENVMKVYLSKPQLQYIARIKIVEASLAQLYLASVKKSGGGAMRGGEGNAAKAEALLAEAMKEAEAAKAEADAAPADAAPADAAPADAAPADAAPALVGGRRRKTRVSKRGRGTRRHRR